MLHAIQKIIELFMSYTFRFIKRYVLIISILVIGLGYFAWQQISTISTRQAVETTLNATKLEGEAVYSKVESYCTGKNNSLFGEKERCGFAGYKIYRHQGELMTSIKRLEETLKSQGFQISQTPNMDKNGQYVFYSTHEAKKSGFIYLASGANTKDNSTKVAGSDDISFNGGYLYGIGIFIQQ